MRKAANAGESGVPPCPDPVTTVYNQSLISIDIDTVPTSLAMRG